MSAPLVRLLRRSFDIACAIAGLALLAFLGPWMLLTTATSHVPEAHELTRLDGITDGCRPVFGGVRLLLQGHENEFQLQLDSCMEAQVVLAHSAHVVLNVMPADLAHGLSHGVTPGFGLEVEGKVVRTVAADLRTARLDRAVVTATGITGTLVLLWLAWNIGTRKGAFARLLIGESPDTLH
jgi:hypothetical protein